MTEASLPPLDFLPEPAFVIGRGGAILGGNAAARALVAAEPAGQSLFALVEEPPEAVGALLRRARRSTSPTVGRLTFAGAAGRQSMRTHAARLPGAEERLVLRCLAAADDQFALLSRRVRELDAQLRLRLQQKAALEEALRSNQTLLDELQHRVKNNIQMMMSLVKLSAKGRRDPEVAEFVEAARLRLHAMASTQEAIYQSRSLGRVRSRGFLGDLLAGIGASSGFAGVIDARIEDVDLDNQQAHCLALIVNELVTNAAKHALKGGAGAIRVTFGREREGIALRVADDGPGMPPEPTTRSSGLQLVRSLCRQIGGRLDIETEHGTTCHVRFGSPQPWSAS